VDTSHIRYVHGVDFSGAEDAGKSIWIATGIIKGKTLEIEEIRPAKELPTSGRKEVGGVGPRQALKFMGQFWEKEAFFTLKMPISGSKSLLLGTLEIAKAIAERTRKESALA
jgi:hypothetical protein